MVYVATIAGFECEADLRTQTSSYQSVMHGTRGHGHGNRQYLLAGGAISHQQNARAALYKLDGALLQIEDCLLERAVIAEGAIQVREGKLAAKRVRAFMQRRHLAEREKWRRQYQSGQRCVLIQQVRPGTETRPK